MTPLTWNATRLPSGATDFRVKHANYLDQTGWRSIDCSLVDIGSEFSLRNAPFSLSLPKLATGQAQFVSTCKFDIFAKTNITEPDFSLRITPIGVSPVGGHIDPLSPDTVVYPNAYLGYGDLLYVASHGRAPRFQKLIRINTLPAGAGPLRISFKVTHDAGEIQTADVNPTPIITDTAGQIGLDIARELAKTNNDVLELMRLQFAKIALRTQTWKTPRTTVQVPVSFRQLNANGRRGIGIKPAQAWDSSTPPKRITIQLEMVRETDGSIMLTKIIPRAFLTGATLPVMTDTVSTFYPDANVESTSVDGYCGYSTSLELWSDLRSGSGNVHSDSDADIYVTWAHTAPSLYDVLYRAILLFDTSSIPDTDVVSAADLSVFGTFKRDTDSNAPTLTLCGATPASNTDLVNADYGQTQTVEFATAIAYASFSTSGYNAFSLTDLTTVVKTGVSKYSTKVGNDTNNSAPSGFGDGLGQGMAYSSADESGTSQDPKLAVTHAAAGGGILIGGKLVNHSVLGGRLVA